MQLLTNTQPSRVPWGGLCPGFLCLLEGCHSVQTAADTDSGCFTCTLAENLLLPIIMSEGVVEPPLLLLHSASAQPHMGPIFEAKKKKKSIKIDFIHKNDGIMYLTCLLSVFIV